MTGARELKFPAGPWVEELVGQGLAEDVGTGDVSSALAVAQTTQAEGVLVPRQPGVTAGLPLLEILYRRLDSRVGVELLVPDGTAVETGAPVARLRGPARALLTGERLALNFLQHLGGIATLTARYVEAVAGTSCLVLDTRKTLPGYRALAKYAVRCGGGANHRMGLYDRIMLKDNHWAARSEPLADLVARARRDHPGLLVQVEVDTPAQLAEVLALGVDWILLDNFTVEATGQAVALRDRTAPGIKLESSGNVDLQTVGGYARAGVDAVSVGRLTHSAQAWDLGLDLSLAGPSGAPGGTP